MHTILIKPGVTFITLNALLLHFALFYTHATSRQGYDNFAYLAGCVFS